MKSHITSAKTSQTGSANAQTPKTTSQLTSRPFAPISKQTTSTPNPHQQQEQTEGLLQRKTNLLEILDLTASPKKLPETNNQPGSSEFAQRIKAKRVQQSKGHQKLGISAIQRQPMREEEMQPQESLETNSSIKERVNFPTQPIQAKLKIGAPGDKYEQEADALASQVMSLAELESVATKPVNASIQREILPEESLQCKSDRSIQSLDNIETRLNKSKGGGSPLSADVRGFMEPRFGTNLKNVRVHTGSEAVQMSRELSAEAFTHGSDIYYGSGKSPGNNELTAHELTHVMQQTGAVQSKYNLQKTSLLQLTKTQAKKSKPLGNPLVKELQVLLNKINTSVPILELPYKLKVDGIYISGGETEKTLRALLERFENKTGIPLKFDGELNKLTVKDIDQLSSNLKATSLLVKDIQQKLNKVGMLTNGMEGGKLLDTNGIFDKRTYYRLKTFQEISEGFTGIPLKLDRTLNKSTVEAINQASNPKAAPLKTDELILTTEPTFANEESLHRYRNEYAKVASRWPSDIILSDDDDDDDMQIHDVKMLSDVHLKPILFGSEEKQAITLKWDNLFGEKPKTTNYNNYDLSPIEARLCVRWLKNLRGWSKLDSSEQSILGNMVGGETNSLSKQTRNELSKYKQIAYAKGDDQKEWLSKFMTSKNAIPGNVNEPITTSKVPYDFDGPLEYKDYRFRSKKADADIWGVSYENVPNEPLDDNTHIVIFAPKAPEPGYHNHTVQEIAEAVSYLPRKNKSLIKAIILEPLPNPEDVYWAAKYKIPDFQSFMTADASGEVNVYPMKIAQPLASEQFQKNSMIHETGHIWSKQTWGNDTSKDKWLEWQKMMDADKVSLSRYAMANIHEDFSETFAAYVGTKNSPAFDEYRQIVPNRFAMLDKEYK